jgi:hypothetical protein
MKNMNMEEQWIDERRFKISMFLKGLEGASDLVEEPKIWGASQMHLEMEFVLLESNKLLDK